MGGKNIEVAPSWARDRMFRSQLSQYNMMDCRGLWMGVGGWCGVRGVGGEFMGGSGVGMTNVERGEVN